MAFDRRLAPKKVIQMEMCTAGEKGVTVVALGDRKRRVRKDKIFKIRLDQFELDELNRVAENLKIAERATAFRYLLHHYDSIREAAELIESYNRMIKSKEEFEKRLNLMRTDPPII